MTPEAITLTTETNIKNKVKSTTLASAKARQHHHYQYPFTQHVDRKAFEATHGPLWQLAVTITLCSYHSRY